MGSPVVVGVFIFTTLYAAWGYSIENGVYPLRWYCAVTPRGIVDMTRSLPDAQALLQGDNPQAIVPMRGDLPEHPLSIARKWRGGSANWKDEYQLKAFMQMCARPSKRVWYCNAYYHYAVQGEHEPSLDVVKVRTLSLKTAQDSLGVGDQSSPRAIIPMTGFSGGDPHSLPKKWQGGAMWWLNYGQIYGMRDACERAARENGVPDS